MLRLEAETLTWQVRAAMGELLTGAENLKGVAQMLDGYCELSGHAEADELKQVATGIRAAALHALLTAMAAVGVSERLAAVASVRDALIDNDDMTPPDAPGDT
ncbi:MAG TPA: hypothetical protein VJN18_01835 [Polyangiaceae bacterium]|nr:hypothetical protein [Polyangiaceae bacterium]